MKFNREVRRGALAILSGTDAYIVHGEFNPESTVATFNNAIEAALKDGFNGFRAVADMSWALGVKNASNHLIEYEALMRSLFATTCATGLCLYNRDRMPLNVLNGALDTHPVAGVKGHFQRNPFYKPNVTALSNDEFVTDKLRALTRPTGRPEKRP